VSDTEEARALPDLGTAFGIEGDLHRIERLGSGHIHDTWVARYGGPRGPRFVHQALNLRVFPDPRALMENVVRVTEHLRARAAGLPGRGRRGLEVVPARSGEPLWSAPAGGCWRTYRFIEGTSSYDRAETPALAREAARAFGSFARGLADLAGPPLHETIPGFHDFDARLTALRQAIADDAHGRRGAVSRECDATFEAAESLARALAEQGADALPRRNVHNDCKLNNVLFDARSGAALCVIDLDTVMAGDVSFDFGDLVRTAACPTEEDERDLARVRFDLERFESLAAGYLEGAGALLRGEELQSLPLAGARIALETGIRFLTDHLDGDVYFRIARPDHNLDRARTQLHLTTQILAAQAETRRILAI